MKSRVPGAAFPVNTLGEQHLDLAQACAAAKGAARFAVGRWEADAAGVPVLGDALVTIGCVVDGVFGYGSHDVIVGRGTDISLQGKTAPLIYVDRQFGRVVPECPR